MRGCYDHVLSHSTGSSELQRLSNLVRTWQLCDEDVVQTCMHEVTISETWHEKLHKELYMCIAHDGCWELKGTGQLLVTQHCLRYVHRALMMLVQASLHGAE